VRKRSFAPFDTNHDHFTKTGLGQTYRENCEQGDAFSRSGNECQVIELPNGTKGHTDGTLMMNSRYEPDSTSGISPSRIISYSTSSGRTWTAGKSARVGDLVRYAGDSCESSTITAGPAASPGKKTPLFAPFCCSKNVHFTKTGSGQT
jgi:hypothetical protein